MARKFPEPSDTELVIMSDAGQCLDGVVQPRPTLRGDVNKALALLTERGWIKPQFVDGALVMKVTTVGLDAINYEPDQYPPNL